MLKDIISHLPAIHREGFLFIGIFAVVTVLLFTISETLGIAGLLITIWCVCFFRDPERVSPADLNLVLSPADGKVDSIVYDATPPAELKLKGKYTRVSVFLSVFDVHVNRIPIAGKVKLVHYHPGQFVSATLDKSSELNERTSVLIETKDHHEIGLVQIAGLIARRIVCDLNEKQEVSGGDRYGIIRFGSRVDVYLPDGVEPKVMLGQYMIGGETIIANLKDLKTAKVEKSAPKKAKKSKE